MDYKIVSLPNAPQFREPAAQWFHEKWDIPLEAYLQSIDECLNGGASVPQWYLAIADDRIIAGLGIIENDFHNRTDLTPNICAVYTEQEWRGKGIAGALLNHACADMAGKGIHTLYLITDHTSFYERYGWEFLCMVQADDTPEPMRMYVHRMPGS